MGVLWPQLSKVLKVVCWAGSVPFPPVSLQRQVVLFADVAGVKVFISGESLPTPLQKLALASRIGSRRVTNQETV